MACFNPSGQPPNPPRYGLESKSVFNDNSSNPNPIVFSFDWSKLPVERIREEIRMIEKRSSSIQENSSNLTNNNVILIVTGKWANRNLLCNKVFNLQI